MCFISPSVSFLATLLSSPEPMAVPHGILQFWSVPHGSPKRQERCSFITDDGYFESARVAAAWLIYLRSPSTDPWTHCVIPLQDHGFCVFFLWRGCDYLRIHESRWFHHPKPEVEMALTLRFDRERLVSAVPQIPVFIIFPSRICNFFGGIPLLRQTHIPESS